MSTYVHIYDLAGGTLRIREIKEYLVKWIPKISVDVRDEFIRYHNNGTDSSELAVNLASTRVLNPHEPFEKNEPMYGEIEYEKRVLAGKPSGGILYDGFELSVLYRSMIQGDNYGLNHIHIAFTDRLIGTFDENDLRYHARTSVYSQPSIISTTGFVEAPAKPTEYYVQKAVCSGDAAALTHLKEKFSGRFLDYGDSRLTETAKGYVMQALVYMLTGEAFCESKRCRLFNAHWQKEIMEAQLSGNEFCGRHQAILKHLNERMEHND